VRRDLLLIGCYAGVFAVLTAGLAAGGPLVELDLAVQGWVDAHRPGAADTAARMLNLLGQGAPLLGASGVLALWWGARRWRRAARWWRAAVPLAYVAAAAVLAVPSVLAIKAVTARGAPSSELPPEQTVMLPGELPAGEYASGYPGGHVVNTVVWYGVLLVLVTGLLRAYERPGPPRAVRLGVRTAPPAIVLATTTYLSFHWFTDGLAGLVLGLLIDRLLHLLRRSARVMADPAELAGVRESGP
jgi:hypothetical protein